MKGYALDMRVIKWTCKCKTHSPSGMCHTPDSHEEKVVDSSYHGSFFYGLKTQTKRRDKFKSVLLFAEGQVGETQ